MAMKTLLAVVTTMTALCAARAQAPVYVGPRARVGGVDPVNNVIYVATNGNNNASGTINAPYRSINVALGAASPGDTIVLRGGTYQEGINVRVRRPNITIKSAHGEWAVIDLPYSGTEDPDDPAFGEESAVYFDPEASGCTLRSVEVIGGYYAVCLETKWAWGGNDDYVATSNILIEDCVLHHSRYDVVKIKPNCNHITIRYNEIHHSGRAFAVPGHTFDGQDNAEGIDNVNGDNMVVQNNYIHDICSNGIYAKGGASDAVIENNIVERTYGAGIMLGFDTSPKWFDTFYDPNANPHYYENIRGIVRSNLVVDTGWEGIGLYASLDAQVYNNTLVNVANLGLFGRSAIYFGIALQDWDTSLNGIGRPPNTNPNIHHNVVCQPNSIVLPMIDVRYDNNSQLGILSGLAGNPTMDYNCYFITNKNATFSDHRAGRILSAGLFPAWQPHISGDTHSVTVNPLLDADRVSTNALCAGMGIQHPLRLFPLTTANGIPLAWLDLYYPNDPNGHEHLSVMDGANGVPMLDSWVAGLVPTNRASRFLITNIVVNALSGAVTLDWTPNRSDRVYTVKGLTNLTDRGWSPTNNASRFFKVEVGLP